MWANPPVQVRTPILNQDGQSFSDLVTVGITPAFYAVHANLPADAVRLWVSLEPRAESGRMNSIIYYDGLVLAAGDHAASEPPHFTNADGSQGVWGGLPFENMLRNASAESAGPGLRSWADDLGARLLPDHTRPSLVLTSLLDFQGAGWLYELSGLRLLRTFWGLFGWGHVPLLGYSPYRFLGVITLVGLLGAALALARLWRRLPWETIALLGLVLLGAWVPTLVRGAIYLSIPQVYLPVARYAFPAIIPTILILNLGWLELARWVQPGSQRTGMVYSQARPVIRLM